MTSASYTTPVAEQAAIHEACCRWRKQGLVCSTCHQLQALATHLAEREASHAR